MAEYICPHCKKPIHDDDALLCLYCGESLSRYGTKNNKTVFIIIAIFVLLCFILLIIR